MMYWFAMSVPIVKKFSIKLDCFENSKMITYIIRNYLLKKDLFDYLK